MKKNNIINLTDENFDLFINEEKKYILVCYGANWCSPCKIIFPILEEINDEYNNKLLIGKIDIDKNPDLTLKYNIKGIPTFLIFYKKKVKDIKIGTISKEELKVFIEKNL